MNQTLPVEALLKEFDSSANALLLFSRALLHQLGLNSTERIRICLVSEDELILTFGHTFLQNLALESAGRIELANGVNFGFEPVKLNASMELEEFAERRRPHGTWLITGGTGGIGLEVIS